MQDRSPSPTALKVAALRALHQTAENPPVFVDPLAERILGSAGTELLALHRATASETARLRGTLAARGVIAEETIAAAVARGIRQCVVIGAGLDTFAYRHAHPDLVTFEVDQPTTQTWKRDLLRKADIIVPPSVRYAALDLEHDDLLTGLTVHGFDRARPAIFAMLGVAPYLASESIFTLLRGIATCDAGSEIVFDYTEPFADAPDSIRLPYEAVAARVAAGGEPWITLFAPAALHLALRDLGFAKVSDLDAAALHRRFCAGRSDGLTIAPLVHLIRART